MVNTTLTKPFVLSASTMMGNKVRNLDGEDLGKIEEIMIDIDHGTVAYAVLSFGGFMGVGDKLFAVPWKALKQSAEENEFIFDVDKKILKKAPGFDQNDWPQFSDRTFATTIYKYYKITPYW